MNLQKVIDIDFERCFLSLKKNIYWIILALFVGLFVGVLAASVSVDKHNRYGATATVYSISYGSYSESEQGLSAIRAYSDIIKSHRVADRAALLMGESSITGDEIYDMISTDDRLIQGTTYVYENQSSVIGIHAESGDAEKAIRVANAVADAFAMEVNSISEKEFTRVLDYAVYAEKTYDVLKKQFLCIGMAGIAAMMLTVLFFLYREIFYRQIRSIRDAGLYGQLDIIGAIPKFENPDDEA